MLIYSHKITERLRYTMDLILHDLLGLEFELTEDVEEFKGYKEDKFSYSQKKIGKELHFTSAPLLFERDIKDQQISLIPYQDTIGFYASGPDSAMPFDPFAASFFMASRYEEYMPFLKDVHNRFPPEESVAHKKGFLQKPVVNIWSNKIRDILAFHFPHMEFRKHNYHFTPTYDIDMAWAYKNKGFARSLGGYYLSLRSMDIKEMGERTSSILRMKEDPYFNFEYMRSLDKKYGLQPIYFILVGDFDKYDKNIPVTNKAFQDLIKDIADHSLIGIHPSYASNYNKKKMIKEKERLEEVLRRQVHHSRQHYLMLEFPRTYQNLIDMDITDDYTLGYTSQLGFRAGLCTPFYFYNLQLEMKTKLRLQPFGIMDATLQYYQKLQPEEALGSAKKIVDEVKAVGGNLMTLWHNNSFSEQKEWTGWRRAYESLIEYALP